MGLLEKGFGTGEEAAEVELLQKLLQVSLAGKAYKLLQANGSRHTCSAYKAVPCVSFACCLLSMLTCCLVMALKNLSYALQCLSK